MRTYKQRESFIGNLSSDGVAPKSRKMRIRGSLGSARMEQVLLAVEFAQDMIDESYASLNFVKTCLEEEEGPEEGT